MDQKRVGRFQFEFGWILVILSVLIGFVGYYFLSTRFTVAFFSLADAWRPVAIAKSIPQEVVSAHAVSYSSVMALVYIVGLLIISLFTILLLALSILFVSQGIANSNIGKNIKNDVLSHDEIGRKTKKVFWIFFVVLTILFLAYFEPTISETSWVSEYYEGQTLLFGFPNSFLTYYNGEFMDFALAEMMANILLAALIAFGIRTIYKRFVLGSKLELKWIYLIILGTWIPVTINLFFAYAFVSESMEEGDYLSYYFLLIIILFLALSSIIAIIKLIKIAEGTKKYLMFVYLLSLLISLITIVKFIDDYDRNFLLAFEATLISLQLITWRSLLAYLRKGRTEQKLEL